ncbi:bifunctional methylenetetrahydrofolate dehydrogenase/methenyltetrahydrofolate cyclohydrolase FolD [Mesorhizobium japonicum]|uniref:bifunctional methylenetetrahydrofolate dehydrogenase/methenyltetrahydrofolate cyclohydrolase FolD n=1 Tax=Mesorhizobium japonicum TaxID=2066070 RepID=UPI003B5C1EEC
MNPKIIDGKKVATELLDMLRNEVTTFRKQFHRKPGLAVILVGNNAASSIYVKNKISQTMQVGMESFEHHLKEQTSEIELLTLINALNNSEKIDGILVQLPLPAHIDAKKVLLAINPTKDVDGFHPYNAGQLATGGEGLTPCTPLGCMMLAKSIIGNLTGVEAVIVGRSNIVGKPLAQLLTAANATVTLAHSGTQDLQSVCRRAELLIVAVGQPKMVQGSWIKPGAVVIDVGINRLLDLETQKHILVGDVDFDAALPIAKAITPVPGGVGPMTIACLLQNTLLSANRRERQVV